MTKSSAVHINRRGRSVEQIQQEELLRREINQYLDSSDLASLAPGQIKQQIVGFLHDRRDLDWALRPPEPPALAWRVKEALHLVVGLLLVLVFLPLLLLGLPLFVLLLRYHEKRDKPDTHSACSKEVQAFRDDEDFWVQNQIVAAGFL